ncbi:MAG: TonB family protein [Acidobacteria bacterium]|nr:TonB family protein [Acidobacteriota bacterium]
MRSILGHRLEKKSGELTIAVSILFSISLAQAGKTSGTEKVVRKSGVALEQEAVKKVEPVFPPIAKAARASGAVKVEVTIDEAGKVVSVRAVSGHPLLRDSALAAARQWKFKPTIVSGKPAKVGGILTFNFVLDDGKKSETEVEPENLDPSQANLDRGTDLLKSNRYDEAIAEFRRAIDIKPDNLYAHYKLGLAYIEAGRYTDQPKNANVLYILAGVYLILGRRDEVITNLKNAIKLAPDYPEAHFGLGMAYSAIGDKRAAMQEYRILKKLDKKQAEQLLSNINNQ